jgi:hypothetical protein
MKGCIAAVMVMVVSGICGVTGVEAATPPAAKSPTARCFFPSARALGAVIVDDATKQYLAQGYAKASVSARVLVKRPAVVTLTKGNVSGLTKIAPTTGNPAMLQITTVGGNAPLELGCNADAEITTTVVLVDSAGVRTNGRSITKVTVQGALQ